jgi:hypothetical protein
VAGRARASRGGAGGGRASYEPRGVEESGAGSAWKLGKRPVGGGVTGAGQSRGGGLEVEDRDLSAIF